MTSLELAEQIARAVRDIDTPFSRHSGGNPIGALRVLHEHGYWFCRVTETEQGSKVEQLSLLPELTK
jgi:hypothetical protein